MAHEKPGLLGRIREDLDAVVRKDPATRTRLEAILFSPGLHALWWHRIEHRMWQLGWHVAARLLATRTRRRTGVEIHPAAVIGRRVVIDHGMGVVIGETATVGDDTLIYHGVTLGGRSDHNGRRHPNIGRDVLLGAGCTILGPLTVGDGARIGAGSVVVTDVAAGETLRAPLAERERRSEDDHRI